MVFEDHKLKLRKIERNLNRADYDVAKLIVKKHMESELKGNAFLNNLKIYIDEYNKILEEIYSDIEALEQDKQESNRIKNRDLRVNECKGKVELARQKLDAIKEIMEGAMQSFKE